MCAQAVHNQIVWFDVPCGDLDRAIRFYSAVLGCEVHKHETPDFALGVLPHEGESVGGCLVISKDNQPGDHGVLVYLNCNGRLDDAEAAVVPNGGQALAPHGRQTLILDSEGNRVALHST